jgi:DNA-binding GntR family transcriptional regulator
MLALVKDVMMTAELHRFTPIPAPPPEARGTMAMRVYRALRQAIVTMRLLPGNSLSEAEVAKQMQTSRQPVREAFIKLSEIGLVDIIPQRGTFVVKISPRDVENARFIREAVETAIARKACELASARDLAVIEGLLDDQVRAAKASDQEWFLKLDDGFHQAIASSADCLYGWRIIEDLKAQMDRVRFLSLPEATPIEKVIGQHRRIAKAIAARDGDAAAGAMHRHLSEILVSLPKLAGEHAELFETRDGSMALEADQQAGMHR